ncbi:probable G-protein coupled receptor Mth-like 1 [Ctenocephalides felis]|uniref:probable G-protein coupled receptor Mth-like 1 n=1 Tax=Ctenocephalides felis TaxID=7515 RepID=UPI000E6E4028|nr:probable G-protein coupled receptor Mth-like 1 [Ctenocephalides felis]
MRLLPILVSNIPAPILCKPSHVKPENASSSSNPGSNIPAPILVKTSTNSLVQKCCRLGEMLQQLDPSNLANSEDDLQCIPGLGENWLPQIYAPARKVFLNSKITPSNWQLKELSRPFCGFGIKPKLVHLAVPYLNYYMLANGSLFVEEHHVLYDPKDFCIDKLSAMVCDLDSQAGVNVTEQVEAYIDARLVNKKKIKIRKCCGEGGAYSRDNATCVVVQGALGQSRSFDVQLEDPSNTTVSFVSSFPTCKIGHAGFAINALPSNIVRVQNDGSLFIETSPSDSTTLQPSAFCIERALPHNFQELQKRLQPDTALTYNDVSDGNTMTDPEIRTKITSRDLSEMNNVNLQEDLQKVHVFSCIGDIPIVKTPVDTYDELRYTLYPISLALSVIFLLATLAVGFLVPGNHHALHWRCQTYYVTCLLFGDTLLAVSQLAGRDLDAKVCVTIAILMHFFFLAAFFWLNTMCFNIWWTFR